MLVALVVIFIDRPTVGDILVVALLLLLVVLLGVIEFLNQLRQEETRAHAPRETAVRQA